MSRTPRLVTSSPATLHPGHPAPRLATKNGDLTASTTLTTKGGGGGGAYDERKTFSSIADESLGTRDDGKVLRFQGSARCRAGGVRWGGGGGSEVCSSIPALGG